MLLGSRCVCLDGVVLEALKQDDMQSVRLIRQLLKSLEQQYQVAKQDMLLAAHSSPLHGNLINMCANVNVACRTVNMCLHVCCVINRMPLGAVSAVHKCVLDVPGVLEALDRRVIVEMLSLLEKITLLLLGVLYGHQNTEDKGTLTAAG